MDGKGNYIYEAHNIRNYDGDSFTATLRKKWDAGYNQYYIAEFILKIRIGGVDTPELRDKRPLWKAAAKLARDKAYEFVNRTGAVFISHKNKDKYGRAMGDFKVGLEYLSQYLIANRLAVRYDGQNKATIEHLHKANIEKLDAEGKLEDYK